jgi:hypothetical protein
MGLIEEPSQYLIERIDMEYKKSTYKYKDQLYKEIYELIRI